MTQKRKEKKTEEQKLDEYLAKYDSLWENNTPLKLGAKKTDQKSR